MPGGADGVPGAGPPGGGVDTLALYDYVRCGTWGIGSRHLACKTRSLVRVSRRDRPLALHPGTCSFLSEMSRVPSGRKGTLNPVNGRHPHAGAEWQLSPLKAGWSAPHSACYPVGQSRALGPRGQIPLGLLRRGLGARRRRTRVHGSTVYEAGTWTRSHFPADRPRLAPPPHRVEGRIHRVQLDGLLAALTGCFAHFPHGTFMLSGSGYKI